MISAPFSLDLRRSRTLLAGLDDEKRRIVVLHELEGLSMSKIAGALGCPLQTAYSRLHAARDLLQAAWLRARKESP